MTNEPIAPARYRALQRLARSTRRPPAELVLAAYELRRPTRDVDLQAEALDNDRDSVRTAVADIADLAMDDGLQFVTTAVAAVVIRDEDEYPGVRVTPPAKLATARLKLQVDINVGDPVWPAPLEVHVPRLLDNDHISVRGYPLHMVHAEKIITAIQRGTVNTRWRDFADIYLLSRARPVDGGLLQRALDEVGRYRSVDTIPLRAALEGYAKIGNESWRRWRPNQQLDERLPESFAEVLAHVCDFADPAILGTVSGHQWKSSGTVGDAAVGHGWVAHPSWTTDKLLPAGSVNHATARPSPW